MRRLIFRPPCLNGHGCFEGRSTPPLRRSPACVLEITKGKVALYGTSDALFPAIGHAAFSIAVLAGVAVHRYRSI